ncbi:hypothetical protein NPIL_538721 [Nephila pilipes]|uniref:Uncharacterized protein n=1 Tax=Nephila pilipes TaxID=299642 RepID=A0A8X6NYP5_NEPPI|nr:hypothetical protein NPIL_538721 [Nephila pilipes]
MMLNFGDRTRTGVFSMIRIGNHGDIYPEGGYRTERIRNPDIAADIWDNQRRIIRLSPELNLVSFDPRPPEMEAGRHHHQSGVRHRSDFYFSGLMGRRQFPGGIRGSSLFVTNPKSGA